MRQVARLIARAIEQNRTASVGNTLYDAKTGRVYLYGNCILFRADGVFMVHMDTVRRWPTNTTRSRINELCYHFGSCAVVAQKNWELQVNPDAHLRAHRWLDGSKCGDLIAFKA